MLEKKVIHSHTDHAKTRAFAENVIKLHVEGWLPVKRQFASNQLRKRYLFVKENCCLTRT